MSRLTTIFGADTTGLQRGLDRARNGVGRFATDTRRMMLRAFAVGAVIAGLRSMSQEIDRLGKISQRLGIGTDFLQDLAQAADEAGVDLEAATKGIVAFQREVFRAGGPSAQFQQGLDAIGLELADLQRMNAQQMFDAITESIGNVADEGEQLAAAYALLRDRNGELLPLINATFNEGGLAEAPRHTKEVIDSVQDLNDAMSRMGTTIKTTISPAIVAVVSLFRTLVATVKLAGTTIGTMVAGQMETFRNLGRAIIAAFTFDRQEISRILTEQRNLMNSMLDVATEEFDKFAKEAADAGMSVGRAFGMGVEKGAKDIGIEPVDTGRERTGTFATPDLDTGRDDAERELRDLRREEEGLVRAIERLREAFEDPANIGVSSLQRIGGGGVANMPNQDRMLKIEQDQLTELKRVRAAIEDREAALP